MNIAVILSGGSGSRMKSGAKPKQYLEVGGKPIICYCLEIFQKHSQIDAIVIVAEEKYQELLDEWMEKEKISKFADYAPAGRSRQHSIYSGITVAREVIGWYEVPDEIGGYIRVGVKEETDDTKDIVIIHDAARPCVSEQIITDCINGAKECGGAMPVITLKDTVYQSKDGTTISGLLNRDELFAGQAPEAFKLDAYLAIHDAMSDEELGNVRGSSEIAYRYGMKIKMVKGDEANFKITTKEDLDKFKLLIKKSKN
ncbi:MAG: 2-C-methyl-D-erythritol 4-phosphate cytidylyltransferase [Clostridia bacterium]|nr:2-C-methyl-D-erythritol 4-phosphate cytidylyltransferase [Clostridia bacterium]